MDYLIDQWTSDDGLPDASVTSIAQTSNGYIWVGTFNGLARFDGSQFVNFDPLNTPAIKRSHVIGLFVDDQDTLWINTYDGAMISRRDGVFTREWSGGQVSQVFMKSNEIYFVFESGKIVCRDEARAQSNDWKIINLNGQVARNGFQQDKNGNIWFLLKDGQLGCVSGTNARIFLNREIGLENQRINYLTRDDAGRLWVGTDKGIASWNGRRFENQTPTNGNPEANVSFLFCSNGNGWAIVDDEVRKFVNRRWEMNVKFQDLSGSNGDFAGLAAIDDNDGGVWFRHTSFGLFHVKADGTTQRISVTNGLPDDRISCWLQGKENNLWLGANPGGLVRLRKKQFQVIGTDEGLANAAVSTICEDARSNIWIGTFGGGLNRLRDDNLKRLDFEKSAGGGFIFSAYPDPAGRLWLSAGNENLFLFENGKIMPAPQSVGGILATLVDREGRIWLGTQNGLKCLTNGVLQTFVTDDGIQNKVIRSLAQDRQGAIWIGTRYGDLYKFADGRFTVFKAKDNFQSQPICTIFPDDDGTLWLGTFRGGLVHFKNGDFTRYTTQNGLPNDIISQILEDDSGKIWIGSHNGIFSIAKKSLQEFDEDKIPSIPCVYYGQDDGLPTRECSSSYQPACWRAHDGTLWFATLAGAVAIRPDRVHVNFVAPKVAVEQLYLDGKLFADNLHPSSRSEPSEPESSQKIFGITSGATLVIPPGRHRIEFRYTALSFTAPDGVRFRYQLSGVDGDWIEAGGRRFADYGPLSPGKYNFRVIACNSDAVWNMDGSTIQLIVKPFFWQTLWFDIVIGLLLAGIIFGAARRISTQRLRKQLEQVERQRAIEFDRERIAKDIHDDIGAGLTQIMLQCSLARREPQDKTPSHLAQISETAHELVKAMDEIVWAVNPENDTLEGLINYIGKFAHDYLKLAQIRCRLHLPAQLPAIGISAEVRHNLFLAVKEILNNAVKHACATEVSLLLELKATSFTLVIKDNGRGLNDGKNEIAAGRIASGQGLKNLVTRIESSGGACTFSSAPDKGTQVELTFPIQKE